MVGLLKQCKKIRFTLMITLFILFGVVTVFLQVRISNQTQMREISQITEREQITFQTSNRDPTGVTLRVQGHIDGVASVFVENWPPLVLSGDIDLKIYHDHFHSDIKIEYLPQNVANGRLTFDIRFH
jgi:hypothetical protein